MLSILYLTSWEYYHLKYTVCLGFFFFFKYVFRFKVFSFHTWDSGVFWYFEVTGSLGSLLLRRLYCIRIKGLALFLHASICCLDKAFSDEPDVVCKQTPPASPAGESLEYSTGEQLLLDQSDTVIYEVSNPLAFEEFRPSHLSFVFISVVLVTHCPRKPPNGSVDLVAHEWGVISPFLGRETKQWMRDQERMGKRVMELCLQRGKEAFLQGASVLGGVSEWKCLNNPFLGQIIF